MCVDLQKTSKNSKSCNGREKEGGEDSSEMAKFWKSSITKDLQNFWISSSSTSELLIFFHRESAVMKSMTA